MLDYQSLKKKALSLSDSHDRKTLAGLVSLNQSSVILLYLRCFLLLYTFFYFVHKHTKKILAIKKFINLGQNSIWLTLKKEEIAYVGNKMESPLPFF